MSKAWFITGASSGLGKQLTERALSEGDTVAANVRRPDATVGKVRRQIAALDESVFIVSFADDRSRL